MKFLKRHRILFARLALFIVYFWFGVLKLFGTSPANPLVNSLLQKTLPFITFHQFIIALGLFEMLIGLLFLIKRQEKLAFGLMILHQITTTLPLILLPQIAWQGFFMPTLEGQYIIKNILILALAVTVVTE